MVSFTRLTVVAAAALAGAVVGSAAERALMKWSFRSSFDTDEPFGSLRGPVTRVEADDGTQLHAEIDEPEDPARADVTIIFCHGYSLNLDTWHYERRDLRGKARLVFWDQRSHGRSARGPDGSHTIDQLGRDLGRVIDTCAPVGTIILVGHSMGGMTVMALAAERPELFGDRVQGVALLATSSGHMSDVTFNLPRPAVKLMQQRTDRFAELLAAQARGIDKGRARTNDLNFLLTKRYSFGGDVSRSHTQFVADLLNSTPMEVVAAYLPEFGRHDKEQALAALQQVRTLVMVGDSDALTPDRHSREIVRHVPGADLVIVPATGHMIISERHQEVDDHLEALLDAVRAG